jgi:hypothetical protein
VRCRYLIVVPRRLPAATLVVDRRAVFIYRGAQAVARGAARCRRCLNDATSRCPRAAQELDIGAQTIVRGGARCASRVHDRGA